MNDTEIGILLFLVLLGYSMWRSKIILIWILEYSYFKLFIFFIKNTVTSSYEIFFMYLMFVFFVSLYSIPKTFWNIVDLKPIFSEPAVEKYILKQAFIDVKKVFIEAVKLNTKIDILFIGSIIVIGLFSLIHLFFVVFFYLIYSIFTFPLKLALGSNKATILCPNCHQKGNPIYVCPSCGAEHKELYPNKYGLFSHTCKCGEKLPTLLSKKSNLITKCSSCGKAFTEGAVEADKFYLPIIGGPSAGKTNFAFGLIRALKENSQYDIDFSDTNTKATYEKVINDVNQGILPNKTLEKQVKPLEILLKKDNTIKKILYLYDVAGEIYQNEDKLNLQKYNKYISGIIFIIDPFSILKVQEKYKNKLQKVAPSKESIDDILSRLIHSLENTFNLKKTEKCHKPISIVINKIDELENEIINNNPKEAKQQLEEWGQYGFLQMLETKFSNVSYFGVSSLNSLKGIDKTIIEPIKWIL